MGFNWLVNWLLSQFPNLSEGYFEIAVFNGSRLCQILMVLFILFNTDVLLASTYFFVTD